jgi:predicted permease
VTKRPGAALRLSLALVSLASPVVPRARRPAWRRQWDADLRHQWAFLVAHRGLVLAAADLAGRAAGALPHAIVLRLRSWSLPMFLSDVRFGARMLVTRPAFSLVAILLLGLGIGANATIFSWARHFVLEPIDGVADAGRLVSVHGTTLTRREINYSYPNFDDTRDRQPDGLAGMTAVRLVALNVHAGGEPQRAWGELVTANYFSVLGVPAALGRTLIDDDDRAPGASAVVVLSHGYWQRRFGSDPAVVGRSLQVNGRPFTVVGVAPEGFRGASSAMSVDLWVPMMMQGAVTPGDRLTQRGNAFLNVMARLSPGATIDRAQAGLSRVAADLAAEYPDVNTDRGAAVYPLWRDPGAPSSILAPVLGVLVVVVGIVLVIICANLANLLLARATGREREIAVRLALGAGRMRIVRQLLAENVLLAMAGGAVGLIVAVWSSQLLGRFVPPSPLPIDATMPLDVRLPLISFGLALVTTVAFGLVPAWQSSRATLAPALRETRGVVGSRRVWIRNGLVVGQVAMSIVLLVGAGLFIRTLQRAQHADVGFDLERGTLASLDLLSGGYDEPRGVAFFRQLLADVESVPGVTSAALARDIPLKLGGGSDTTVRVEGYEPGEGEELTIYYDRVSPGLFETLGFALRAGRTFADQDDNPGAAVVVINETMARRFWEDGDAVGGRVFLGEWATVVGVVGDATYTTIGAPPVSYMYLPLYAYYRPDVTLVVRSAADPASVMGPIRDRVKALDPNLPLFDERTFAEHRGMAVFIPRLAAMCLGLFGALALILTTVGLYGLLAFNVGQRRSEIGVRLALGAQRGDIRRLVVWQGLRLTIAGAAIGFVVAFAAMPLLSSQLVGVSARDGLSYFATSILLLLGAVGASYLPARHAAAVDPIRALRYE